MTDILRDDVPDLPRARYFGPDWHLEYERPTTSAANQSGFHTARSLGIHSKFLTAFDFGYVANGASIQYNGVESSNQTVGSLSFPATTSAEGLAVGAIRYPAGWPRNHSVSLDVYYFTTAASSTASARMAIDADLKAVGASLSTQSASRFVIGNFSLTGSTAVDSLVIGAVSGAAAANARTMRDDGSPYSLTIKLLRQSSTAADTIAVPLHVMGIRFYLDSTE